MAHPENLPLGPIESVRRLSQEEAAKRRKVEKSRAPFFLFILKTDFRQNEQNKKNWSGSLYGQKSEGISGPTIAF